MKKILFTAALLALGLPVTAQVAVHIDPSGIFYVGENALVYNGGGLQTKGNGVLDVRGNVMVQGNASDVLKTLDNAGTGNKTDGGNIILRLNNPANHSDAVNPSTYGQLYINGVAQSNISAVVDKEYRAAKHGTYQQIALPFHNKTVSSLSGTGIGSLGKTFTNTRYSQNEVLVYNNATAVSDNLNTSTATTKGTAYYMLGSRNMDTGNPPATMPTLAPTPTGSVYTLKGIPFASGATEVLLNAANGVDFGATGNAVNYYNERYNSYHQDYWDATINPSNPWAEPTFGRNLYQFGNPYLTNLDLGMIGVVENGAVTDNNAIGAIQGISYNPGTVVTNSSGTFAQGASVINFTTGTPQAVGDVGLIIKPMQSFIMKLRNNNAEVGGDRTLSFDNLRRFKATPRADGTSYSPAAKQANNSIKQLGVIGLDENGAELARAYYAVYPNAITGHTTQGTVQSVLSNKSLMGTYEENAAVGGYDLNYKDAYWLYINEANENDFLGKAVPLVLYSKGIKSLKFEVRENTQLIADGTHKLSTGVGFYYKGKDGNLEEVTQNKIVPVTADEYSLFFGKAIGVLGVDATAKPSRTRVVYNPPSDKFVVRFDPDWKKADISVFDMTGKLIITEKNISADQDYEINLLKTNQAYIVTAVSEQGAKISSKIVR